MHLTCSLFLPRIWCSIAMAVSPQFVGKWTSKQPYYLDKSLCPWVQDPWSKRSCQTMGQNQEPPSHELREAEPITSRILFEGNNGEGSRRAVCLQIQVPSWYSVCECWNQWDAKTLSTGLSVDFAADVVRKSFILLQIQLEFQSMIFSQIIPLESLSLWCQSGVKVDSKGCVGCLAFLALDGVACLPTAAY